MNTKKVASALVAAALMMSATALGGCGDEKAAQSSEEATAVIEAPAQKDERQEKTLEEQIDQSVWKDGESTVIIDEAAEAEDKAELVEETTAPRQIIEVAPEDTLIELYEDAGE